MTSTGHLYKHRFNCKSWVFQLNTSYSKPKYKNTTHVFNNNCHYNTDVTNLRLHNKGINLYNASKCLTYSYRDRT